MNRDNLIKEITDKEDFLLVRKAKEGDRTSFNELVLRHQDRVYNICFRITGDYDIANDCAQETFLKVFRKIESFREKSKFSTWIHRIAVNTCKNHLTSSYFRREYSQVNVAGDDKQEEVARPDISDSRYDPEEHALNEELRSKIEKAVLALPLDLRIIVIMKDIEEKTYEEVADILNMKDGTVKSRLSRARKQLRKMLQDIEK